MSNSHEPGSRAGQPANSVDIYPIEAVAVSYDEKLLEKARSQWQFGDWASLAQLNRESLRSHPDKAQLALFAAAGHLQMGANEVAKALLALAMESGCSKHLILKILVGGCYNSLGCSYLAARDFDKAMRCFEESIAVGLPQVDVKLAAQARMGWQSKLIGDASDWSLMGASDLIGSVAGSEVIEHWRKQAIEAGRYKALFSYLTRKDFVASVVDLPRGFSIDESGLGKKENFYIKDGYRSRESYTHYDDMQEEDRWQLEVYLHAFSLMKKNGYVSVVDYGCGSGYKLVNYLGSFQTIGFELPQNIETLKEKYPDRDWRLSSFSDGKVISADLIICSDVIEHLVDPNELLRFFGKQSFKYLILSTPDRNLVRAFNDAGPPANKAHVREWSFIEFRRYISDWFEVVDHRITNIEQGTQMLVCRKPTV